MTDFTDEFRGGDEALLASARALLAMDAAGSLVPHGLGGHGRNLLNALGARFERAMTSRAELEARVTAEFEAAVSNYRGKDYDSTEELEQQEDELIRAARDAIQKLRSNAVPEGLVGVPLMTKAP